MAEKDSGGGWGKLSSTGLELAAAIGLGVAIGYWIDSKKHTSPWGVIVGFAVGFIVGFYLLIKEAMKSNKD